MSPSVSKPRLLVIQHVSHEPLGTLGAILGADLDIEVQPAYGDPVAYRHVVADLVKSPQFDGLVLLGGPPSVYDHAEVESLEDSIRLTRSALKMGAPILGLCLGAQLLAWCLGAQVVSGRTQGRRKEIGWFPVSLTPRGRVEPALHGFDETSPVFHWHGDTFALPEGSWHLASSAAYPNQGFRWGRWAYGLQFHVEVTADLVREWVTAYADELAALDYVDVPAILAGADEHAPALAKKAEVLGRRFVECVQAFVHERSAP